MRLKGVGELAEEVTVTARIAVTLKGVSCPALHRPATPIERAPSMSTLHAVDDHSLADEDIDLFMLLCQRSGWSDQYLKEIESTEHDELLDLAEMVEALHDSRSAGQKISIAPYFDTDGISSGILGHAGLSELGLDVELHLPDYRRGCELAPEDVAEIHAKWPDARVLLTSDGGVNSRRSIAAARALGWTTLVTDHPEELAPGSTADITVDPSRIDETYAHTGICGAHDLYRVIEAYTRVHRPEKLWEIRLLRLFAGLGTDSDVMPVPYENRRLVRDAISIARLLRVAAPKTIPNPWGGFDADPDAIDIDIDIDIDIEQSMRMQLLRTEPHHPVFLRAFEGFAILLKAFAQAGKLAGDQLLAPWMYLLDAPLGTYGLPANRMMGINGLFRIVSAAPAASGAVHGKAEGYSVYWTYSGTSTTRGSPRTESGGSGAVPGVAGPARSGRDGLAAVLQETTQVALLAVSTDGPKGDLVLGPDADRDAGLEDLQPLFELVRRTEGLKPIGYGFTTPVVEIAIEPLGLRVDRIGTALPAPGHPVLPVLPVVERR
ncbi:phosphoesterase [Streptomyces sp. H27-H1]|uniref:phosphoesterase n=1 Tax=Streptomyces sp. H27-H1 TaxID=2996461 RepID=UPI00227204C1|nr:phosphoesterase [Streptomyces sp. H27-H1]MCY0929180.1 phosphoesterase [Streptomyces sp. H27-H1]